MHRCLSRVRNINAGLIYYSHPWLTKQIVHPVSRKRELIEQIFFGSR